MELTDELTVFLGETARTLKGSARRVFMARAVHDLGAGGQRLAERKLGWSRVTVRKGRHELESGIACVEGFALRARKRAEDHLPHLLTDIRAIVDSQSQADPQFRTRRLYMRLTAGEVRRQVIAQRGYTDAALPCERTIATKLNRLGYTLTTVAKSQPPKKVAQTDAIFAEVTRVNAEADAAPDVLRVSMDAKATVKIGPFARGGKGRMAVKAADHDFQAEATVTPVGLFLPQTDELFLYHVTSKVTSDGLVDRLEQWWGTVRNRFVHVTTRVLNLDTGPESHSHRTQFMARLVAFVRRHRVSVRLAYYPPYHSTYNPVERCWGILEAHWNGALLDSLEAVCGFTASMAWKGLHPVVELVTTTYATGVKLTKEAMTAVEAQVTRLRDLDKWFVDIPYVPEDLRDA